MTDPLIEPVSDAAMIAGSNRVRLYIIAILCLCAFATLFVLGMTFLRPEADNMPLIIVMLGIFTPVLGALLAAALKENHDAMNSRLTQLLALTAKASKAEGKLSVEP